MVKSSTTRSSRDRRLDEAAEAERTRILYRDILGQTEVHLSALDVKAASAELAAFSAELWRAPNMDGYFDRRHLVNLRAHLHEALHGFTSLASGGVMEILSIPSLPEEVMGFHIFNVFDPMDDADHGRVIGYAVWSLERGKAPFGQAEKVRMAFDIFPDFRDGAYRKVAFTNHEIYNISRRILYRFKPREFRVDAKTQISQTRTGDSFKRAVYYLKRGYYPPDARPLADALLVRLTRGDHLGRRTVQNLIRQSRSHFWVYPIRRYLRRIRDEAAADAI